MSFVFEVSLLVVEDFARKTKSFKFRQRHDDFLNVAQMSDAVANNRLHIA
jgi:hypothetical protein